MLISSCLFGIIMQPTPYSKGIKQGCDPPLCPSVRLSVCLMTPARRRCIWRLWLL